MKLLRVHHKGHPDAEIAINPAQIICIEPIIGASIRLVGPKYVETQESYVEVIAMLEKLS